MDALISGQAGAVALVEGNDITIVQADNQSQLEKSSPAALAYLFQGCNDVQKLKGARQEAALHHLDFAWKCDRAIRMILILLDGEEYSEVREEAAYCLEELIAHEADAVIGSVENQVYSYPLPKSADLIFAQKLGTNLTSVSTLLGRLAEKQDAIVLQRNAWEALPNTLFDSLEDKRIFEETAIANGAFRRLGTALAASNDEQINLAILACYRLLDHLPNYRAVVTEWTRDFRKRLLRRPQMAEEPEQLEETEILTASSRHPGGSRYAFENAIQQQAAIIDRMRHSDFARARKYADDLVHTQLGTGGKEYAAKSLCRLAQEAKRLGLHSLQLEWALRARDISFDDPIAHGHAADAYIEYSRLSEAAKELEAVETLGDRLFAATGRARILRRQAKLDAALSAFREARESYRDRDETRFAWLGAAETLRDMWRLEDALAEYEQAILLFPLEPVLRCGRAAVLTDLGRLEEALAAYDKILTRIGDDVIARNGRATVFKAMGRLDDAINAYDELLEHFPSDSVGRCGRADVLRLMGDFNEARTVYHDTLIHFPYLPVAYSGYAEVLRDMGEYDEAIKAYEDAHTRFPYDSRVANGLANIHKVAGDLDAALRLYDENVRQFPYDLVSKAGRADLLKRHGKFNEALDAYDQIIRTWSYFSSAKYAKAAILTVLERFDEAEALLPEKYPETEDEWTAFHVRGMILFKRGMIERAIIHFTDGSLRTPFVRKQRSFRAALAAVKMSQERYQEAATFVDDTSGGVLRILKFHALAGLAKKPDAEKAYSALVKKCPVPLIKLRDEIAAWYRVSDLNPSQPKSWLFDKEFEAVLMDAA